MLSDLCFADLLLFVPVDGEVERFVVVGQVRPTTSQTLHREDLVGHVIDEAERPLVARCLAAGQTIVEGEVGLPTSQRAGPAGVHPGAFARPSGRRRDPGVGPVGRAAAR